MFSFYIIFYFALRKSTEIVILLFLWDIGYQSQGCFILEYHIRLFVSIIWPRKHSQGLRLETLLFLPSPGYKQFWMLLSKWSFYNIVIRLRSTGCLKKRNTFDLKYLKDGSIKSIVLLVCYLVLAYNSIEPKFSFLWLSEAKILSFKL